MRIIDTASFFLEIFKAKRGCALCTNVHYTTLNTVLLLSWNLCLVRMLISFSDGLCSQHSIVNGREWMFHLHSMIWRLNMWPRRKHLWTCIYSHEIHSCVCNLALIYVCNKCRYWKKAKHVVFIITRACC